MRYLINIFRALLGALIIIIMLGASGSPARLYVVNALSEDLSVIDTATDRVVARIPLEARGYHIAFSPKGDLAYVTATALPVQVAANAPAQSAQQGDGPTVSGLLTVDLAKKQVVDRLPLEIAPLANVHMHPDGKTAYVVTAGSPGVRNTERGRVLFVDLDKKRVARTVAVGLNPLDSAITPDGSRLYTADWASRSLSVVDLKQGRLQDTIPLGAYPARALAMSPHGDKLYAALDRLAPVNDLGLNSGFFNYNNNNAAQVQMMTPQTLLPVENGFLEIDTGSGVIRRHPIEGSPVLYVLATATDGKRLYIYQRVATITMSNAGPTGNTGSRGAGMLDQPMQQQQRASVGQQAKVREEYELISYDLDKNQLIKRYGDFGYLSNMTVSPDGEKLYLVGTPGDPVLEADVRTKNGMRMARLYQSLNDTDSRSGAPVANGPTGEKGPAGPAGPAGPSDNVMSKGGTEPAPQSNVQGQANLQIPQSEVASILDDLRRLPKTVTVLDVKNGKTLRTLTVGSLPQGSEIKAQK